jgi:hypothetical protein
MDKYYDLYERKVKDVLTLLAEIGGLQKALFAIGMVFVTFVAQKIFMAQIVHKIYQIRKYEHLEAFGMEGMPHHVEVVDTERDSRI